MSPGWPRESFTNGIVSYVATLAPQLRAMGHKVSILAGGVDGQVPDDAVYDASLVRARRSLSRAIVDNIWYRLAPQAAARHFLRESVVKTARRMSAEQGLQILEMEESFGLAWWTQRAASIPVAVRLHGPWFLTGAASGFQEDDLFRRRVRDEGRAIAGARAVSAPANDVLDRVRAHYGIALPGARVIPNPTLPVAAAERWSLGGCERQRLIFVGRFDRLKGGDLIVEAFARLLASFPEARLTLVGPDAGLVGDDGRAWKLEEFLRHRLPGALESGRVEWLGRQPFSALAALRRRAQVCVVCSRYENYPNTVTEAMALGCPIVAARTAGIPEIIQDGVNGLLHRPGDAVDLAEHVAELLRRPELAARLGERAGEDCQRLLYPDVVAQQMVDFYREALSRGA